MRNDLNWFVSRTLDGATSQSPGYYPEKEDHAASIVAPAKFVSAYLAEHDPRGGWPGTRRDAVLAWAREQGLSLA